MILKAIMSSVLLLVLTSVLSACTFVQPPEIEHLGVREISSSDDRMVYGFAFRATNPNKEPLPLGEVRYSVLIDGNEVFSGVRSPEATLDAFGDREFEIPAVLESSMVPIGSIMDYRVNGVVTYIPPGRFAAELYRTGVSVPNVEFSIPGRLDLSDLTPDN